MDEAVPSTDEEFGIKANDPGTEHREVHCIVRVGLILAYPLDASILHQEAYALIIWRHEVRNKV